MRTLVSAFQHYGQKNLHDPIFQLHDQIDDQPLYHLSDSESPVIDLATLPIIAGVLLLSALSLSFIYHLRLKSRTSASQLREFNHLWTVRVLLVFFISYWSINEIIHLPFFFTIISPLSQQDDLCKLHVVFSLGFLEPGFLITLLFILNESIKENKTSSSSEIRSVLSVLLLILPTSILQMISVFFIKEQFSMSRSFLVSVDDDGNKSTTCTFPLLSSLIFGAFALVYSVVLLVCCWRVVRLVINRNVRLRVMLLGFTVIMSLVVQSVFLGVASFWRPLSGVLLLGMFVSLAVCAGVAEIVLVIKPILEALVAGGDDCRWNPVVRYLHLVEDPVECVDDDRGYMHDG